jgi:WD40 repeat protein
MDAARTWRQHRRFTVAFDPQGQWLATGSDDQTARLCDLEHPGREPRVLRGHTAIVRSLASDPNGRWLATGSGNGTARLWQLDVAVLSDLAFCLAGRNTSPDEWRE